jgi:hypothetical protein
MYVLNIENNRLTGNGTLVLSYIQRACNAGIMNKLINTTNKTLGNLGVTSGGIFISIF